jgi:hypothetical protein
MNMRVTYTTGADTDRLVLTAGQYTVFYTNANETVTGLAGFNSSGISTLDYEDCGVFEGIITAEEFEKYKGETITATIPAASNADYEWNTGLLTINYHMLISPTPTGGIRQTTTTAMPIKYATIKPPEDKKCVDATKVTCNRYATTTSAEAGSIRYINGSFLIYDNELTEENLATYFDGLQICYPIEPYTIQQTAQPLALYKGYNALWSDSGDTTIQYVADTKLYIDNKIAEMIAAKG